jgi:branched-chain amino acid transport system ATP-binding protein
VSALAITSLTKAFSGLRVIAGLSMTVAAGERRLIIGPNGAGKTTLFNLIAGELEPDTGRLEILGRDVTRVPARRRAHLGLARTYQIITLFPASTLRENVALALLGVSPARWNPFSRLDRNEKVMQGAEAVLARVGLDELADRPLRETAYGEQRRVEIAMALAQNPRLLLLDEPFAGLSTMERSDVKALIAAIPRDVTIVMIEHDMDVALDLAEQITVLHFGQVVVEGARAAVVADARTREIYLGT